MCIIVPFMWLLNIIPMILHKDNIMPYFKKLIHGYGCNLSILWSLLKS